MRIGELARRSGVTVPTIKYYIRTGLLPGGKVTARNQAHYDESHVRRLRLIRALLDVGGLSVLAARELLRAADDAGAAGDPLRIAGRALASSGRPAAGSACAPMGVAVRVDDLVRRHAWPVPAESDAAGYVAGVLASMSALGVDPADGTLDAYATAAMVIARIERETLRVTGGTPEALAARAVLGEALLTGLYRLAAVALSPDCQES